MSYEIKYGPTTATVPPLPPAKGSGLTDADKIAKAIELLERLEADCLVPDYAHDALETCPICRLLKQLKAPNNEVSEPARHSKI